MRDHVGVTSSTLRKYRLYAKELAAAMGAVPSEYKAAG
jgi:hypothetical protein